MRGWAKESENHRRWPLQVENVIGDSIGFLPWCIICRQPYEMCREQFAQKPQGAKP